MRNYQSLLLPLLFSFLGVCTAILELTFGQIPPNPASDDSQVAAHFQAAQVATAAGNAERAIQEYREVLRLKPDLLEARVNLGLNYYMAGQYREATLELERARQVKPDLIPTNLFLGMTYQKLGVPAKAIPPLQTVVRQDSANRDALRTLAACYVDLGDYNSAASTELKLFAASHDPVEAWYALGKSYMAMENRLGDEDPKKFMGTTWEARLNGDALAQDHKWVDAAAQYRRAVNLDAGIPGLHAALGNMLLRQSKWEDAEAEFRAELISDPRSEEAFLGLAAVDLARAAAAPALENVSKAWDVFPPFLASRLDFPEASIDPAKIAGLTEDLASAPDSPAREFLLTVVYGNAGQAEEEFEGQQRAQFLAKVDAWKAAQKSLVDTHAQPGSACSGHRYTECAKQLSARKPRTPEQDLLLGKAQAALGDQQAASAAFAEALRRAPGNAEARYWLLRTYQSLAVACLKHVVDLAPDSWRVHQIQGEYAQSRFDYAKALEEFQAALRQHPESAELHEQVGNAYLLNKNAVDGKAEIEKALHIDPTRTTSLYLLGRLYFQAHDIPKSIEYLQAALRLDPSYLPARAELGRAYMRNGQAASAVPELEKAVSIDSSGDLYYLLSTAYRQLGKTDQAERALATSLDLRKKSAARHEAGVAAAEEELAVH